MVPVGWTVSRWLSTRIPGPSPPHSLRAARMSPKPSRPGVRSTREVRGRMADSTWSTIRLTAAPS